MTLSSVSALGYLELGVIDLGRWRTYCEVVLGLAVSPDGDALNVRMDDDRWRMRLLPTGEDDLRSVGFRVDDEASLEQIVQRLTAQGIGVSEDPETRDARGVEQLYVCSDPDGLRIELFVGDRTAEDPFESPAGVGGFVTGDQGLGHLLLMVGDAAEAEAFYQRGLGFRESDYIVLGTPEHAVTLTFLHCNQRHHTLAYIPAAVPKRLNHLMLQTVSVDDVVRALDRANAHGVEITASLGRHTNDRMLSFYMRTPSGFDVEYGHGGLEVDDANWEVATYDATSIWGHQRPA